MANVTARGRASDVKLARALITTLCIEFPVVSTWVFLSQPPWVRHESDLACLTADSCKFTGTTTAGQFCSNHLDGQLYDLSLADCKQTCLDYQCSGGYWHPVHTENGETYGRVCKLYGGSIKPGVHCAPSPHWSVTVTLDCSTTGNLFCSRSDLGFGSSDSTTQHGCWCDMWVPAAESDCVLIDLVALLLSQPHQFRQPSTSPAQCQYPSPIMSTPVQINFAERRVVISLAMLF